MNAQSIGNKLSELELYISLENPDIVGVCETWVKNYILDSELSFNGYVLFRRDRKNSAKQGGGGLLLLVRDSLKPVIVSDFPDSTVEFLSCNIECGGDKTLICICYRPDYSTLEADRELYSIIDQIDSKYYVIGGDFNFRELRWGEGEENTIDRAHPFVQCMDNNFLSQVVDKPTRRDNYLDLLLTSDTSIIENLTVGENFSTSDHQIVRFELVGGCNKVIKSVPSYNYFNKTDYNQVRNQIKNFEWNKLLQCSDIDSIWDKLKTDLLDLRNNYIGCKKCKQKNKCKWVTNKVQRLRVAKKRAWVKYQKSNKDCTLYEQYKTKLRESVKENKRAKLAFEKKLADNIKTDCKSFYSYISSKSRTNNKVGPLKDDNNRIINGNRDTAEFLNNYFSSVFTRENLEYMPEAVKIFQGDQSDYLMQIDITEEEVLHKLLSINVNKSVGPDEIHGKLLYEIRNEIVKPLTHLFKLSLCLGQVPQDWRDANVIPLYKKGSRHQASNYRPVSLTSVVGKMLEKIVKFRLMEHLDKHKLIRETQHGFQTGKSCLSNLLEFFEDATKELDENKPVDIVYLDFSKAFDKVSHVRLIKKLEAHGIGGQILEWIRSWLKNRRQKVIVEGEGSKWVGVTSGVPQGSVLGPICFLVYLNDLEEGLVSKLGKFADDSKMLKSIISSDDAKIVTNDLRSLEKWAEVWQMQYNVDKCSVIHMGNHNPCSEYSLGNKPLNISDKERDLGVIIDKSLKFSEQSDSVVKKANSTLGMIKRNIVSRNKDVITKLYKALVRPKLEYCVQAWRPFLKKDIEKIERVQHRATKMIFECRNLSYEDRLKVTGLTTLEQRRNRGDMIEVFKSLKGLSKLNKDKLFTMHGGSKTRGHRYKLAKKRSRLDIRKHFFSQRIVNQWNNLPEAVVEASSVNSFKNKYDKFLGGAY